MLYSKFFSIKILLNLSAKTLREEFVILARFELNLITETDRTDPQQLLAFLEHCFLLK